MHIYRLYFLNDAGHITSALNLDCADDEAALAAVAEHADGRAMELWDADRRVGVIDAWPTPSMS